MDLKKHLIKLQGKEYLPVAARIVAFRETHPTGAISTELVTMEPRIVVRASIHAADGVVLATGYGTAPISGKGTWQSREIEKAETAAIGRALAHAGFGTLYATDADDSDGDNLADSPVSRNGNHFADLPQHEPTPEQTAKATNGWTMEAAQSLVTEAKHKHVTNEELLGVLGVARISEFQPGLSAARKLLADYVKARPAQPAQEEQVVF